MQIVQSAGQCDTYFILFTVGDAQRAARRPHPWRQITRHGQNPSDACGASSPSQGSQKPLLRRGGGPLAVEGFFRAAYYRPRLHLRLWRRCGRRFFWLAGWVTRRCPGGVTPAGSGHVVGLFPFCPQERRRHGGTATDFSAPWRLSRLPIIRRRTRVRRPLFRSHVPAACRGELPVPARPGHYGTRRSDAGPD